MPREPELVVRRVDPVSPIAAGGSLLLVEVECNDRGARVEIALAGRRAKALRAGSTHYGILELDGSLANGEHELVASARVAGSIRSTDRRVITLVPRETTPVAQACASRGGEPLVAICLTTYEPPGDLLARQLESIRRQQHANFVCLVSDDHSSAEAWRRVERETSRDERFVCSRTNERVGFYRNFERCLAMAPPEAEYVAFADQDDDWQPHKLSALVREIERTRAKLVFSDMNLVDPAGRVLTEAYRSTIPNNFSDLGTLLLTNTVTGASALFRRSVVDDALPFPPQVHGSYHDHWVACVALATGTLGFVDQVLYDYVQHDLNASGRADTVRANVGGLAQIVRRLVSAPRARLRNGLAFAETVYTEDALRLELFARTLATRLDARLTPEDRRVLRRAANVFESNDSLRWLLSRSLRDLRGAGVTLGVENNLLKAVVLHRMRAPLRR